MSGPSYNFQFSLVPTMKKLFLTVGFAVAAIFTPVAQAQIIPLTVNPNLSSVDVTLDGQSSSSQLSGTTTIDFQNLSPPSGSAQITQLDFVLDDALSFRFGVSILSVTVSSTPGDVMVSMVSPGAPGTISGTTFDQLANVIQMTGDFDVNDPFGLAGGSQTIDLSTIPLSPLDATAITVTQSGDTITVSNVFSISEETDFGLLEAEVTYVATGVAPAVILGDVNQDDFVTFLDISPFIALLSAAQFQAEADCNEDGMLNFLDISFFINILAGS